MPIFCQKNVQSHKNTLLSYNIFRISIKNSLLPCPYLVKKKVNSVKTTLYYGRKKSIGCPFLPIFQGKITALMPMLFQKDVHSLKNTLLSCPYFVEKTSILSKTLYSHIIFLTFKWKTPCCHAHIWSKNRQFCQNYIILWIKKVNRMLFFFPIFHGKVTSLMPIFCQESVHSQKNPLLSSPYFIKTRPFSQKHCGLMSVFQNFYEKLPAVKPIFGPKNVNSVKTTLSYGPQKSKKTFFSDVLQT